MKIDDCYQLGYIVKTHGLKGEVIAKLDVDFPEEYQKMESVYLEFSGTLVPFFISELQINGSKALIRFEDYNSIDKSEELIGHVLMLPLDNLNQLHEGEYYYHEFIGCEVFEGDTSLGFVEQIYQPSAQFLLSLNYKGQEVLIPIADHIIKNFDRESKRVDVVLPDGLLDIFMNS